MKKKVIIIGFVVCFIIIIVSGIITIKNVLKNKRNNEINKKIDEIVNNNEYEIKASSEVYYRACPRFVDTFKNRLLRFGKEIGIVKKDPDPSAPILITYYIGNDYIIQIDDEMQKEIPEKYNSNDEIEYYKEKTIYYFDNGETKKLLDNLDSFSCEKEEDFNMKVEKDGEDLYNLSHDYSILLNEIIDKSVSKQTSYEKGMINIENLRREIDERKFN